MQFMKKILKMKMPVIVCLGMIVVWQMIFPSGTWRYRMTVTVETPEGVKTGSAVREVHVSRGWLLTPEMQPDVTLKGEAVVVDLGRRGVLFALLSGYRLGVDYGSDIPFYVFRYPAGGLSKEGIKHFSTLKAGPVELQPENYPTFVRFRDLNDPKTVENLLDMKPCPSPVTHIPASSMCIEKDHFEEAFGTGVRLKSVTIEMTKDPVTWGIDKWLSWLPDYYNKRLDGQRYNTIRSDYLFANNLASGDFKAGDAQ